MTLYFDTLRDDNPHLHAAIDKAQAELVPVIHCGSVADVDDLTCPMCGEWLVPVTF